MKTRFKIFTFDGTDDLSAAQTGEEPDGQCDRPDASEEVAEVVFDHIACVLENLSILIVVASHLEFYYCN